MPRCLRCSTSLRTIRQREGVYYECPECSGRVVTLPQVRRVAGDNFATGLLRELNAGTPASERDCPFCFRLMGRVLAASPSLELEVCRRCSDGDWLAGAPGGIGGVHRPDGRRQWWPPASRLQRAAVSLLCRVSAPRLQCGRSKTHHHESTPAPKRLAGDH